MNDISHAVSASPRPSDDKAGLLVPRITDDREIPAFQLIDGVPESRVVLSVPHGGWLYPQSLITAHNFSRCSSLADTGTAELGLMLAGGHYPALIACCCRAVCDLNRPAAALDPQLCAEAGRPLPAVFKPYVAAGYGVIPRLSAQKQPLYPQLLSKACWQRLLDAWHQPYHRRLAELLRRAAARHDEVILADLHSMPDSPKHAGKARLLPLRTGQLPDFVFGNLHGATLRQDYVQNLDQLMKSSGYSWRWNTPYAGGYITRHYGLDAEDADIKTPVQVLQIEVNRSLYCTSAGVLEPHRLAPIHALLSKLLATLTDR